MFCCTCVCVRRTGYVYMLGSKTMKRDQNNYMSYKYVAARRWVYMKICCIIDRKTQT